jgi:DNA-directed RNA polymerase subunit RPC12/RpoP
MNKYVCKVCKRTIELNNITIHSTNNNVRFITCPYCEATQIIENNEK